MMVQRISLYKQCMNLVREIQESDYFIMKIMELAIRVNRGIQLASGQYITFINAEDFVDNNYLETFMNEIGNNDVLISEYKKVTMKSHDVLFTSIPLDCEWTEFKYV